VVEWIFNKLLSYSVIVEDAKSLNQDQMSKLNLVFDLIQVLTGEAGPSQKTGENRFEDDGGGGLPNQRSSLRSRDATLRSISVRKEV
jgi:hypothetical protein